MFGWFKKAPKPVIEDSGAEPSLAPAINQATVPAIDQATVPEIAAPAKPPAPAPSKTDTLLQEYKAKAASIKSQAQELLDDAIAASEPLIEVIEVGDRRLANAWNMVDTRYRKISAKLERAWARVDGRLETSATHEVWEAEALQHALAEAELEVMFETARCHISAQAGERARLHAKQSEPETRSCKHCGGQLETIHPVSMAVNLACGFCNAVNSVDPGPAWRAFASDGALALASLEALPSWTLKTRILAEIEWHQEERDVPLPLLEQFYGAAMQHLRVYETSLARLVPERAASVERTLSAKTVHIDAVMKKYPRWKSRVVSTP